MLEELRVQEVWGVKNYTPTLRSGRLMSVEEVLAFLSQQPHSFLSLCALPAPTSQDWCSGNSIEWYPLQWIHQHVWGIRWRTSVPGEEG